MNIHICNLVTGCTSISFLVITYKISTHTFASTLTHIAFMHKMPMRMHTSVCLTRNHTQLSFVYIQYLNRISVFTGDIFTCGVYL